MLVVLFSVLVMQDNVKINILINTLKQLYRKVELFLRDHNNKVMLVK